MNNQSSCSVRGLRARLALALLLVATGAARDARAERVLAVTAGMHQTCAVTRDGGLKCWGMNTTGQLGDGTSANRAIPTHVIDLGTGVVAVSGSFYHTCAVTRDGALKCWGRNDYGQLGDGTTTGRLRPTEVSGLSAGVLSVAAGIFHTCALMATGTVKCWGANYAGQLGDGTTAGHLTPRDVVGLAAATDIVAGSEHNCVLTSAGGVKCWGYNRSGGVGDGTGMYQTLPKDVIGLGDGVRAVTAGYEHSCALTTSGGVKCWGYNASGQVGDGTTTNQFQPVDVAGLGSGVAAVDGGHSHTCVLTESGAVKCWGSNDTGSLGDGTTTLRLSPVDVPGIGGGIVAVSAGSAHTCALTVDSAAMCWGYNAYGQVGDGAVFNRRLPVHVAALAGGSQAASDYDGDGPADVAVWRPGSGTWYVLNSGDAQGSAYQQVQWGAAGDIPVTGDYDGDGRSDVAVWRPGNGNWYVLKSSDAYARGSAVAVQWGAANDVPVAGDYDGDGRADLAVWRPGSGTWYVLKSTEGYSRSRFLAEQWGAPNDIPVPGDYDGDGRTDLAVWRPGTGTWFVLKSGDNYSRATYLALNWGAPDDRPVPGDYDGDGRTDPGVWRPGTGMWYALKSADSYGWGTCLAMQWGAGSSDDRPVPGDYDGDGRTDLAVWRPRDGFWYVRTSTTNFGGWRQVQWGSAATDDVPLSGPSLPSRPVTVAFDGLLVHGEALSSYTEAGFSVTPTAGIWTARTGYGSLPPFIGFDTPPASPANRAEVAVTAGGREFAFTSVDLYSSVTPIPYEITGLKGSTPVFSLIGILPNTYGYFATVLNPRPADRIDRLVIAITNPAGTMTANPMGIDNVRVVR